jgi:hypothetical protein
VWPSWTRCTEDLIVVDRVCVTGVWGRVEPENWCTLTRGAKGVTWCSGVGWWWYVVAE